MIAPLVHKNTKQPDADLAKEAATFLAGKPECQVLAELFEKLRGLKLGWWTPSMLRRATPAKDRMEALKQRPDIRQRITIEITNLRPNTARNKEPAKQAELIDDAIANGDWDDDRFEEAFGIDETVIYGDAAKLWSLFMSMMPFEDDKPGHRAIVRAFIESCLNDGRVNPTTNKPFKPFLTALDVLESIDGVNWHTKLDPKLLIDLDRAAYEQERKTPTQPFTARQRMGIVTLEVIEKSFPPDMLVQVLKTGAKNLGLSVEPKAAADPLDSLAINSPKAETSGDANARPTERPAAADDGPNSPNGRDADATGADIEVVGEDELEPMPAPASAEGSNPNILKGLEKEVEAESRMIEELTSFGLKFPDRKRLDIRILYRMKKILVDGVWPPNDDSELRLALFFILKGFDPKLSPDVEKQDVALLKNAVIIELGKHPKTMPAVAKLGMKATPPPIPKASSAK